MHQDHESNRPCPEERRIKAWLDGELGAAGAASLEAHVASCAACQTAAAECRRISARLQELADVPAPAPGVERIIATARRRAEEEGRTIRSLQRVALVAAAVIVCAVGFLFFPPEGHQSAEASRDSLMALVLSDPMPGVDY
jgi:anti-sigma factor RsiW